MKRVPAWVPAGRARTYGCLHRSNRTNLLPPSREIDRGHKSVARDHVESVPLGVVAKIVHIPGTRNPRYFCAGFTILLTRVKATIDVNDPSFHRKLLRNAMWPSYARRWRGVA